MSPRRVAASGSWRRFSTTPAVATSASPTATRATLAGRPASTSSSLAQLKRYEQARNCVTRTFIRSRPCRNVEVGSRACTVSYANASAASWRRLSPRRPRAWRMFSSCASVHSARRGRPWRTKRWRLQFPTSAGRSPTWRRLRRPSLEQRRASVPHVARAASISARFGRRSSSGASMASPWRRRTSASSPRRQRLSRRAWTSSSPLRRAQGTR
mmetsp:Transcript_111060/g.313260  ORF Transcript_111060/g.313260 Transcript_111060/m.313260 type:complete len:213 (-) Transcript_111060:133-771(-)